jgi:hypothetical protein
MDRSACGWLALTAVVVSCSTTPAAHHSSDAGTVETGRDAGADGALACPSNRGPELVCDRAKASAISWGAEVTVTEGSGAAPSPAGGTVVPGDYQLVAEVLYGSPEPNTNQPNVGDRVKRVLNVDCGVANELYALSADGQVVTTIGTGNGCWILDPQPISLLSASGLMGPGILNLQDHVSYTARGGQLTLIEVYPYWDRGRFNIVGSFVIEDHFVLETKGAPDATTPGLDGGNGAEPPETRDPRCPSSVPADGDPCSPVPAPLECEYGGDAFRRCTTFAECTLSFSDGTFHFKVDVPTDCTKENPAECPPIFAAARSLSSQPADAGAAGPDAAAPAAVQATCNYPEGVCGCVMSRGDFLAATACDWICRSGARDQWLASGCQWPRPLAGDRCTPGLECDYDAQCSGEPSLGPGMICENGYWAQLGGLCI